MAKPRSPDCPCPGDGGLVKDETMRDALKRLRKRDANLPRDGEGLFRGAKG